MIEEPHRHSKHVELEHKNINDDGTVLVATSRSSISLYGVFGCVFEHTIKTTIINFSNLIAQIKNVSYKVFKSFLFFKNYI